MTSDLITELTYLAATKVAIKEAIIAAGTEVLDTDDFRSYATKISQIDTFDSTYTDILQPTDDMVIFKNMLVNDVQADQGTKKLLLVVPDTTFGMNSGFTSSFDNVTGVKFVGGKYYTKEEITALNNSGIYAPGLQFSRHGLIGGFVIIIIYFDDTVTLLADLNSISSPLYLCSQNLDLSISMFHDSDLLYDMINCKVVLASGYYSMNSSFPPTFVVSDYLSEGIPISFENAGGVYNMERWDSIRNPPYVPLNVTNMESFRYCSNVAHIPTIVIPAGVTSLEDAFYNCNNLKKLDMLDTSNITDFRDMFSECFCLTDVPPIDLSAGTDFQYMFKDCYSLKQLPVLDLYSAITVQSMFEYCKQLEAIEFTTTSKVLTMYGMFTDCQALKSIKGLDFTSMQNGGASSAFQGCVSLEVLEIANITTEFNLADCIKLTKASVLGLVANLVMYTRGGVAEIIIPTALFNEMTVDDLAPADAKNWAIYDGNAKDIVLAGVIGTLAVGSVISVGEITPAEATYRCMWQREDFYGQTLITGTTGNTYTIVQDDVGKVLRLTIVGTGSYTGSMTGTGTAVVTDPVDTVLPVVTMAAQTASAFPDQSIVARSSKATGWLYLVKSTATTATKYDLDYVASNPNYGGRRVDIVAADTDVVISTTSLPPGTYNVYAVDASCNISLASTASITITQGPADVSSAVFNILSTDVQATVTLAAGRFKPANITYADFLYSTSYNYNRQAFQNATYTRISDTVVLITNLVGIVYEANAALIVKASAQYAQVTTVAVETSDGTPTPVFTDLTTLFGVYDYMSTYADTSDDGSFTYKYQRGFKWKYNGVLYPNFVVSGNSWIDPIGSGAETIKFNRRDSKVVTTKAMTGEYQGKLFSKITWSGAAQYSNEQDQIWELYLFANGDAMIHAVQFSPTTGGSFAFGGVTYTVTAGAPTVSFYRQNAAGTSWAVAVEAYDITKNLNLV